MKRLFYLILMLSFILSGVCIPHVSAAENQEEQIQLLTKLSVLDPEITKDDVQNVTRGQFVGIAMHMLGYNDEVLSSADAQMFYDVPKDHDAAGAVNLAYTQGIIDGAGQKMFYPEESVTYEQALKIMISVLGWTQVADSEDMMSWCVKKAGELGIMNGISQTLPEPLTKASMIRLLYNCLDCDALVVESIGGSGTQITTSNLLYTSFSAVKATGTVTANNLTGLKGDGTNQEDEIEIDGVRYYCGDMDAGRYLGYSVTFYYIEPENGEDPQLLLIKERNTTVTEIKAQDLEGFSNGYYTYRKENGATAKIKISQSTDIIYNGKSPKNVNDQMYMPKAGSVRILSRSGSSSADVLFIEDYYNLFVYNINPQDKILYDKYDPSKRLELEGDIQPDYVVVYDSGDAADFSSIKKDSLLSIMQSDDGEYIKIVINSRKQNGTLSVVGSETITMNETKYTISPLFDTALQPKLSVGDTGTLYLDMNGEAAVFSTESSGDYQFGFLINAWIADGGDQAGIKLMSQTGDIQKYDMRFPVSIDSSSVKTADKMISKLASKSGAVEQQIVRYMLNEKGEITKIDRAYTDAPQTGEQENTLHLEYDSGTAGYEYKSYAGSFSGKVIIDDNTVIFSVPEKRDSDDMYTIESKSYFVNDEAYRIKSYLLDDEDVIADAVVVIKGDEDAISDTTTLGLVNKTYTGLSKDEEVCTILSVYNDGILKELPLEKEELLNSAGIESGDIVRFALNSRGEINILEKTYDYSEDVMINSESHSNRLYNAKFKLVKGGLYNKSGKVLMVAPLDKLGNGVKDDYTKYTLVSFSKIYIYDSNARKGCSASVGSENDLVDYLHAGDDYSRLFIRTEYAQPRDIIIYK